MKKKKLLKKILIGFAAVVVLFVLAWILFLPSIVTSQLSKRTGFDVKVSSLSINPFTANARVTGLLITNPPSEFKTPGFVNLQALQADMGLFSLLFGDQLVVEYAQLDLPDVTLVRRANAVSNAELFSERLTGGASAPAQKPGDKPAEPAKPFKFLVKRMDLNLGKVVVANETATGETTSREYAFNYKHTYENVSDPKQFITADLTKSILGVGSQMTDMIPGKLGKDVNAVLQGGIKAIDNPQEAAGSAIKGLIEKELEKRAAKDAKDKTATTSGTAAPAASGTSAPAK